MFSGNGVFDAHERLGASWHAGHGIGVEQDLWRKLGNLESGKVLGIKAAHEIDGRACGCARVAVNTYVAASWADMILDHDGRFHPYIMTSDHVQANTSFPNGCENFSCRRQTAASDSDVHL